MNSIVVSKFGGTSMADALAMQKSAKIVFKNPNIKVVVVSATAGTSNQLLKIYAALCEKNQQQAFELWETIKYRHFTIANDLNDTIKHENANKLENTIEKELNTFFLQMHSVILKLDEMIQKNSPDEIAKSLDDLLSFGERLSASLFVVALRAQNVSGAFFDIKKIMITNDDFGKAEPDLDEIAQRTEEFLKPALKLNIVHVVEGFIGATKYGDTTTLGRGGSDFSAALIAESLDASELQIWTDVPGIMTMDPNVVKEAKIIPKISFPVAAELANFGAKILHPKTLWPAMRKNIKTFVGSTFLPERGGTWIYPTSEVFEPVHAIALRKKQTLITVHSVRMVNAHGFLAKLFSILAENKLSVDLVTTSEVSVALTIDENTLGSAGAGISQYSKMFEEIKEFCDVKIEEGLTLVAIISTDLIKIQKLNARIFSSITQFNVRLICHGASPYNFCFLARAEDAVEIAHHLHKEFIENNVEIYRRDIPYELRT